MRTPAPKRFLDANTGEWFHPAQLSGLVTAFAERLRFPQKALGFHFGFNDSAGLIAYLGAIESGHAVVTLDPELDPAFKSKLIALFQPDFSFRPNPTRPNPAPSTCSPSALTLANASGAHTIRTGTRSTPTSRC